MAHHANTPKSVLEAPSRTVTVSSVPEAATRFERRHGISTAGMGKDSAVAFMLGIRRAVPNAPAVRTLPRRGKKVRRGGLA